MLLPLVLLSACDGDPNIKALKPHMVVTPEVVDFGEVVKDYTGEGQIQIINAGWGDLEIGDISIAGDGAAEFSIGEWPSTLAHDESATVDVTFLPPDPLTYTATLSVSSNDEEHPTFPVTLTGTGREAPTPDIDCDPLTIDYGAALVDSVNTQWFTCTNVGDDALHITNVAQAGSGNFLLASNPVGFTVDPGNSIQLIVVYTPTTSDGDNGSITLTTDDPDEPETELVLLGNGGGDYNYPVAVINGPSTAVPRSTLELDGSESYDPIGYALTDFYWSVEGPYDDVSLTLTDNQQVAYANPLLAGDYRVTLQVRNSQGVLSAPAVYEVEAIPEEDLHVELTWTDNADLDLHLLTGDGELFVEPGDCNYCNINPDWGAIGASDDPTLDLDDQDGPGVENINIDSPVDDTYHVKVHYYGSTGSGDVAATVNVYAYGALKGTYSRVLSRDKVWDVAQILWPDGYVVEESTDLYTQDYRTCE